MQTLETIMVQTWVGHIKIHLKLMKIIGISDIGSSDLEVDA